MIKNRKIDKLIECVFVNMGVEHGMRPECYTHVSKNRWV